MIPPKTILITGAGRGIGYETTLQLTEQGHHVIALSRNVARLKALEQRVLEFNPQSRITTIPFDLEDASELTALLQRIQHVTTKLDAVIHNAGLLVNKPFTEITAEELQRVYQVNVLGPFQLTQAIFPLLKAAGLAHVIGISSMGGVQGSAKFAGLTAYSSSKAAMAGWCEVLAEEWKTENIRVNCLALGAAQTEMLQEAFPGYQAPLSAEEMARFIVSFTLTGHQFFNGKILPVAVSTP